MKTQLAKSYIVTLLLALCACPVKSVGKELGAPFLKNYSPKDYSAEAQNWDILQDKHGMVYFGNNGGVLQYDGATWRLIETVDKTVVRSFAMDDTGRIYVGAQGEIGYLEQQETLRSSTPQRVFSCISGINPSCGEKRR